MQGKQIRNELLNTLQVVSNSFPELRLGQLIINVITFRLLLIQRSINFRVETFSVDDLLFYLQDEDFEKMLWSYMKKYSQK